MSTLTLASIHIHPIKSLGGYPVSEARLTDRGLEHDRRWMLVNAEGVFVTQRELPAMACLHTAPRADGFRVTDTRDGSTLDLPWTMAATGTRMASVWSDRVRTETLHPAWSAWFSERLGAPLALVHMPDSTKRRTDGRYADGLTSLSDGFPYLIASQASLDDLNARLKEAVGMERFRPNLVIAGGDAFQEDGWRTIHIGAARFDLVKPCARCAVVTTDQRTGERGREPLRTLASYRSTSNKVRFGMNAVGDPAGVVRVGDPVTAII
jgi:uncharacterized protein YcbX